MSSKSRSPTKTHARRVVDPDRVHRGAERLGCGLGPRDLAGVDGAVDEVEHAVALEDLLVPRPRPDGVGQDADADAVGTQPPEQLRHVGVEVGVRLPELPVRRQQTLVVDEPGLREDVGHRRARVVVPATAPHRLVGRVQVAAWASRARVGHRLRRAPAPRRRSRPCARASACRPSRRSPRPRRRPYEPAPTTWTTRSTTSPTGDLLALAGRPVADLDDAVGEPLADHDDRRDADQLGVLELHARARPSAGRRSSTSTPRAPTARRRAARPPS